MQLTAPRFVIALALVGSFALSGSAAQTGQKQVIEIAISGGRVQSAAAESSGGVPVIRVRQGQALALRWSADLPMTIHLHGYDIEIRVPRDGATTMDFVARAAGRFPIEQHGHDGHAALLYLEVRP